MGSSFVTVSIISATRENNMRYFYVPTQIEASHIRPSTYRSLEWYEQDGHRFRDANHCVGEFDTRGWFLAQFIPLSVSGLRPNDKIWVYRATPRPLSNQEGIEWRALSSLHNKADGRVGSIPLALVESIRECDILSPIVIGNDGTILHGNLRDRTLKQLVDTGSWWFTEVPILIHYEYQVTVTASTLARAQRAARALKAIGFEAAITQV
jgi:hypothetical protein